MRVMLRGAMRGMMSGTMRGTMRGAMRTMMLGAVLACAATVSALPAQGTPPTRADSALAAYRRAQRLVNDGQGAEGRAIADSMLNAAEPGSPEEADALFWRATLAENWEAAQRDYLRIMLEHERSPRAGDAMLRLAQGESARGDRDAAVRYLERLVREAPDAPARAEADLLRGRFLLERGERDGGCRVLREGRGRLAAGAVELENQYDYLLRGCPEAVAGAMPVPGQPVPGAPAVPAGGTEPRAAQTPPVTQPASPPAATPARDTARSAVRDSTRRPAPAPSPARDTARPAPATTARGAAMWSVQVAALSTKTEADAMVKRLRDRGYDARVDGTVAPYRVRFGLFPTRAAATAALERYKTRERGAAFLVEVPRG